MPRTARMHLSSHVFHVLNRGNARSTVFHKDGDYRAFLRCLAAARSHHPVRVFCFCLMPNHFHFLLHADTPAILGAFMQRWMTSHVRRYHAHYHTSGHLWQDRFKAFPVCDDSHFLTVFRYILQNPVRAGLVERAEDWRWSSLHSPALIDPGPAELPQDLHLWLNDPLPHAQIDHLRALINRPALVRSQAVPPAAPPLQPRLGQAC